MKKTKQYGPQLQAILLSSILITGTLSGPVYGTQASENAGFSVSAEISETSENPEETDILETTEEETTSAEEDTINTEEIDPELPLMC